MTQLILMHHGSHLYGTATPTSDLDFKGVALPTARDIFLGRIPKVVNEAEKRKKAEGERNKRGDVDSEVYSIHYFIKLALDGQTVAIDMLHAPPSAYVLAAGAPHWLWRELVRERARFYTRSMSALVGYARHQAAKYGLKGSRLSAAKRALVAIDCGYAGLRVGEVRSDLPLNEHCRWIPASPEHNGIELYEVCGMKFQVTAPLSAMVDSLRKFIARYGERAKMAETNQGVDWKAVSHAFRAAYQMRSILVDGGFTYPLRETDVIMRVKAGAMPYAEAGPKLEELIDSVEELATKSALPEKPDVAYAESVLLASAREAVRAVTIAPALDG